MDFTLLALLTGSSRTLPSRFPKILCPTQLITFRFRAANIGASTAFIRVSPVFPSRPTCTTFCCNAYSYNPGRSEPTEGVKFTNGQPLCMAAIAYSVLAGSGDGPLACSDFCTSDQFHDRMASGGGGSVDETLTTITRSSFSRVLNSEMSLDSLATAWAAVSLRVLAAAGPASASIVAPTFTRVPGRMFLSNLASWEASEVSDAALKTCDFSSRTCASAEYVVSRISCPPTTSSSQPTRSNAEKGGNALTSPVVSVNPLRKADNPTTTVVATPPQAPISQTPTLRFAIRLPSTASNHGASSSGKSTCPRHSSRGWNSSRVTDSTRFAGTGVAAVTDRPNLPESSARTSCGRGARPDVHDRRRRSTRQGGDPAAGRRREFRRRVVPWRRSRRSAASDRRSRNR